MTLLSDAPSTQDPPTMSRMDKALPRINLKKRPNNEEPLNLVSTMNLRSVNSAFLSGLFSDVAKATEESPRKKTRLDKSMTRCGKSYKTLCCEGGSSTPTASKQQSQQDIIIPKSPSAAATHFFGFDDMSRSDSLHYQLSCVSDEATTASSDASSVSTDATTKLAFPHLPSTINKEDATTASSVKLTRKVSDLQMSVSDHHNTHKESYGWFVEMDGDDDTTTPLVQQQQQPLPNPYAAATNSATSSLAFSAATAPNAANYDAEVEWAQAADTVDDVLGDFF